MSSSAASGLALSIRQAEESETFDLSGQNVSTIQNTIQSAFAVPLPIKEMIRITFITGAGKQARQKYDEGAARAVTSTLRDMGYEDATECAGSFKLQHDTGKNLKTVVVFPRIVGENEGGDNEDGAAMQSLVPEGCPAHKIAMSSSTYFERMLSTQCPSWSQKKGTIAALEHLKYMIDEMDGKLMKGTPLDEAEQEFYDGVASLDDKIAHTKDEMHKQVENGGVTKFEKETLLEHITERIESLATEMISAKGPKLEKLKVLKLKATQRKVMLNDIDPKPPQKLRHEQAIARLWKEVAPLLHLEETARGRLLSVKETQIVARKDDIMAEIEELEEASRGWFEDVEAFEARVKAIRSTFTSKLKQQNNSKSNSKGNKKKSTGPSYASAMTGNTTTSSSSSSSSNKVGNWVTPGDNKMKGVGAAGKKKKKKNQGSGVFAAMMENDSDSDDEDGNDGNNDDGEDSDQEGGENTKESISPKKTTGNATNKAKANANANTDTSSTPKKGGKKKNKKSKSKKKKESDMTEEELMASGAAANAAQKKHEEERQVSHPAIDFAKYLVFAILGIIAWFASFVLGKPKASKQKKN